MLEDLLRSRSMAGRAGPVLGIPARCFARFAGDIKGGPWTPSESTDS